MSKISLFTQGRASKFLVIVFTAMTFTISPMAISAKGEALDCMKLSSKEKHELMTMTLALSIQNASFEQVKQDAQSLIRYLGEQIISTQQDKCLENINSWNFSLPSLTKMTTEEIKSVFRENLEVSSAPSECDRLLKLVFASAMINGLASEFEESVRLRQDMNLLLRRSTPSLVTEQMFSQPVNQSITAEITDD